MGRFIFCLTIFACASLWSHPTGPAVIHGNVAVSHPSPDACHIHASHQAIINWQDFSIKAGELTRFIQPSPHSIVLNRVIGNVPSQIFGTLEANGTLLLLNQNGILFSKDASIHVGEFIGSTLNLTDERFLKGETLMFQGNGEGTITHHGTIRAKSGHVSLFSRQIINEGKIEAPHGNVELAVGTTILLKPHDKKRIMIRPTIDLEKKETGIINRGQIEAIETHLLSDGNLYEYAIQNEGIINALHVFEQGGFVCLRAENGIVSQTGNIHVPGGEIQILGDEVALQEGAHLSVSHPTNPGKIYLGGGKQGNEPELYRSELTFVDETVLLEANALENGKGGEIICWSDNATLFLGKAEVRGGPEGGDGGFIEVSGVEQTQYLGKTDRFSPKGKHGELLLDPESNFRISTRVSYNLDDLKDPTADIANLFVETLIDELAYGPVTIQTSFEGEGGTKGYILLDADVSHSYNSPYTLTFQSTGNEGILWQGSLTNTSTGNIELFAEKGNIQFTPKHENQRSHLQTNGNIRLDTSGKMIVQSAFGQPASVQADGISIHSQDGVLLISSEKAPATLEVIAGSLTIDTLGPLSLHGKQGAPALIRSGDRGELLFTNLKELNLIGESGPATIAGKLTIKHIEEGVQLHALEGPVEINSGSAPLILEEIQEGIDLIAGNASVHLASGDHLSLQNLGEFYMTAEGAPVTIRSEGFLDLNVGKNLVLTAIEAPVSISSPFGIHVHADQDLFLHGNQSGKAYIDSPNAKIFAGRNLTLYSHARISGNDGPLFLSVGNDLSIENPLKTSSSSIFAKQIHLNVSENLNLSDHATIFTTGGALQMSVGHTAHFDESSSVTARGGPLELTALYGNIHFSENSQALSETDGVKFSAGQSILFEGFSKLKSHGSQGITLIADELSPTQPGTGGIVLAPNASLDSKGAPLNLYTSKRVNNSILGTMNGFRLSKAPHFISTKEEQWGTYYPPSPSAKENPPLFILAKPIAPSPFILYHKEIGLIETGTTSIKPCDFSRIAINFIGPFTAEMFRDLHPYDAFTRDFIQFNIKSYPEKSRPFFIRRRTFKYRTLPPLLLEESE